MVLCRKELRKKKQFSKHIIAASITKQWNCPNASGAVFSAYKKRKKRVPPCKWVIWWLQREWEEGTGEVWPPFCFYPIISGDLGEGRHWNEKKPVANEVPWGLEISWSHYLIPFNEKPFNFLLLKRSNLLLVAKLPKLIESWLVSSHFLWFELHIEILSDATCCPHRKGARKAVQPKLLFCLSHVF